jgi:hypothetical protein
MGGEGSITKQPLKKTFKVLIFDFLGGFRIFHFCFFPPLQNIKQMSDRQAAEAADFALALALQREEDAAAALEAASGSLGGHPGSKSEPMLPFGSLDGRRLFPNSIRALPDLLPDAFERLFVASFDTDPAYVVGLVARGGRGARGIAAHDARFGECVIFFFFFFLRSSAIFFFSCVLVQSPHAF